MTDWLATYSASLRIRDLHEQAHKSYIGAYTTLADRTAAVTPAPNSTPTTQTAPDPASPAPKAQPSRISGDNNTLPPPSSDVLTALRTDLSTTQRARGALVLHVEDLTAQLAQLQASSTTSAATIASLAKQKADLERKLSDREEELRVKSRLVVQAQDEQVALDLQLFFAEKRETEAKRENAELVARWMERKGEEAERVNRDSRWE